jgi:hypothetical protein
MGCCQSITNIKNYFIKTKGVKVNATKECQFDYIKSESNQYQCIRCGKKTGKIDPLKIKPNNVGSNCRGASLIGDYVELVLRIVYIHALFKKLFKTCGCEYRKFILNKLDKTHGLSLQFKTAISIITGYLQGCKLFLYWCRSKFKQS